MQIQGDRKVARSKDEGLFYLEYGRPTGFGYLTDKTGGLSVF